MDCDGGGTTINVGYNTPMNLSRDISNLFNSNSNSGGASAYSPLAAAAGIPPATPTGPHPVSLMPFQGLLTPGSEPGKFNVVVVKLVVKGCPWRGKKK